MTVHSQSRQNGSNCALRSRNFVRLKLPLPLLRPHSWSSKLSNDHRNGYETPVRLVKITVLVNDCGKVASTWRGCNTSMAISAVSRQQHYHRDNDDHMQHAPYNLTNGRWSPSSLALVRAGETARKPRSLLKECPPCRVVT
jgi:hypothetical protein